MTSGPRSKSKELTEGAVEAIKLPERDPRKVSLLTAQAELLGSVSSSCESFRVGEHGERWRELQNGTRTMDTSSNTWSIM